MGVDKKNLDVNKSTLTWSEARADDSAELGALYNRCFPGEEGHSFFEDFPIWDPQREIVGRTQLIGKNDAGQIICSTSLRIAESLLAGSGSNSESQKIKLAMIGAVVSDAEHRGQGFASQAIEKILQSPLLADPEVQCVVLWGSEINLYSQYGFNYGGEQKRASLGNMFFPDFLPDPTLDVQVGWDDQIFNLMKIRNSGLKIQDTDLNWLSDHVNVVWFRIIRGGQTTAYVGVNRGIDLVGIVHEWGGSEMDLGILLSAMKKENPNLQIIFHPDHEKKYEFFSKVQNYEADKLCMVKWLRGQSDQALRHLWFFGLDSC